MDASLSSSSEDGTQVGITVGTVLGGRFKVKKETAKGRYGKIFQAIDLEGGLGAVAVKVSCRRRPICAGVAPPAPIGEVAAALPPKPSVGASRKICSNLESEYWALKKMEEHPGFPQVYELDSRGDESYLVMELLERPLLVLFKDSNFILSAQDTLHVVDQLLTRMKVLHEAGMVHGDLKPENLMMGTGAVGKTKGTVYLVDFGLVTSYGKNGPNIVHRSYGGTLRYMSTGTHDRLPKTPRDDLESLAYVLAFFLQYCNLPWRMEKDAAKVSKMKKEITAEELFAGQPKEFANFFDAIRNLKDGEKFEYEEFQKSFRKLGRKAFGIKYGYDWPFWSI